MMNSLQVEEKEVELNDVKSQLLNTQSVLSTAQIELDSLRNKGQQEELQIAEIKMMMHQVNYLSLAQKLGCCNTGGRGIGYSL